MSSVFFGGAIMYSGSADRPRERCARGVRGVRCAECLVSMAENDSEELNRIYVVGRYSMVGGGDYSGEVKSR